MTVKMANRASVDVQEQLRRMQHAAMVARPTRTLERAMSHMHRPQPDTATANALNLMHNAWVAVQKEAGRAI